MIIDFLWASYRDAVLPEGASREQHDGTKLAFYAGAGSTFSYMTIAIPKMGDAEAEHMLSELNAELEAFKAVLISSKKVPR